MSSMWYCGYTQTFSSKKCKAWHDYSSMSHPTTSLETAYLKLLQSFRKTDILSDKLHAEFILFCIY